MVAIKTRTFGGFRQRKEEGRLRALGKTQRLAAAAARSSRAGGRQNAARGRARPGRARWRCPQPGLRSNGRGRGRARHGPGCASSASLRAPVRAALAKGVPVLPAPTPPPPAADPVSRPAASAVAEPPAEVPPPSDTRARHRSRPVPTSRPPPQPPRSLFSSASEPAADGDARGRHVTARRSRGRGRAGGSHAPAASARGARCLLSARRPRWLYAAMGQLSCPISPLLFTCRTSPPLGSDTVGIHRRALREEARRRSGPGRGAFPKSRLLTPRSPWPNPKFRFEVPLTAFSLSRRRLQRNGVGWRVPWNAPIYSPH